MADKKQLETSKIDALYSWLSYDIQKMKAELVKEMKYSSVQVGSLYQALQAEKDKSSQAISQEIRYSYKQNQTIYDGLASMLTKEVGDRLNAMDITTAEIKEQQALIEAAVAELSKQLEAMVPQLAEQLDFRSINETVAAVSTSVDETVKYSYMQQQAIYDSLMQSVNEVVTKLADIEAQIELLERFDTILADINAKIETLENADQQPLIEAIAEKTDASIAEYSRQVLDAVANFTIPENVDYNRIVDEVGDRVLELFNEVGLNGADVSTVNYDESVKCAAQEVVDSLPTPEVDYTRIEESVQKAVDNAINNAMGKLLSAFNADAIADVVAAKLQTNKVDYDLLSDMVVEKLMAKTPAQPCEVTFDYDRVAAIVEEKLEKAQEPTYELVVDEEGVQAIAKSVSEEICQMCATCEECVCEEEPTAAPVEETAEEVLSETVVEEVVEVAPVEEAIVEEIVEEPIVEEVVEAPVETVAEEVVVEEPVESAPVEEPQAELAVTEETTLYDELNDQLVDAETGLVIRLKKSFTAKMKQSEDSVKAYYSDLKNELVSYKRINSNISWHGDRFNFGRDTVAKVNICGKTLCFYLALDPEDPEYKTTVYHQKNVGNQKAYENTPFMVKIKSDAAAKKALRLVGYLAEKLGTTKEEDFQAVDYTEQFGYETTKQLFDAGHIKATKEKKVELDF